MVECAKFTRDSADNTKNVYERNINEKKIIMRKRYFVIKIIYKTALIFLGYAISYLQWSFVTLFVAVAIIMWLENIDSKINRIKVKAAACSYTKQDLLNRIDEIPSWVKFPDRERAEWLNQVIAQLWPTLNNYLVKVFLTSIQNKIRKKHDSFRFENVDFGNMPPKIDGIKVYTSGAVKDSIIIDFDVFYDGNCDVNFSISGAEVGGLRDFQLSAEVRVVLKPLLMKLPLLGGIQLYFLNVPDIGFTLDGLSSIPGLSSFIRSKIEEKITKMIVFPNKITKRFSKSVTPSELKTLEPAGVLRIHVFEAKDLMAKDITGKSDPYVVLHVGAQEYTTNVIHQNLNPKWDYWCEFIIVDPITQHLGFKIFDKDNVNEDDFLGSGEVDIAGILKGNTDQWFTLDDAKRGSLHLRFTWMVLSVELDDLDAIYQETQLLKVATLGSAILIVYVESAINLPDARHLIKPHPFFYLTIGEQKQKSKVQKHTNNPIWEQGFVLYVPNPLQDSLHMCTIDKTTGNLLTQFSYKIADLLNECNLEISRREFTTTNNESKVVMSLQLRILRPTQNEINEDENDTESEKLLSRPSSSSESTDLCSRYLWKSSPSKGVTEPTKNSFKVTPELAKVPMKKMSSAGSAGAHGLGRLEISLHYNEARQKLLVTVLQVSNLPLENSTDIPDPYVRIKVISNGSSSGPTYRTRVIKDSCNPVYEETFEYLFSLSEAYDQTLLTTVKTKKFLYNNFMGQVEIKLKFVDLSKPYRTWFDLCPKP